LHILEVNLFEQRHIKQNVSIRFLKPFRTIVGDVLETVDCACRVEKWQDQSSASGPRAKGQHMLRPNPFSWQIGVWRQSVLMG